MMSQLFLIFCECLCIELDSRLISIFTVSSYDRRVGLKANVQTDLYCCEFHLPQFQGIPLAEQTRSWPSVAIACFSSFILVAAWMETEHSLALLVCVLRSWHQTSYKWRYKSLGWVQRASQAQARLFSRMLEFSLPVRGVLHISLSPSEIKQNLLKERKNLG